MNTSTQKQPDFSAALFYLCLKYKPKILFKDSLYQFWDNKTQDRHLIS